MCAKLILIDQSIKDAGGHHLEYAARVLKAAKKSGLQTILITNKRFADVGGLADSVVPIFTNTFWENFADSAPSPPGFCGALSFARRLRKSVIEHFQAWKWETVFSRVGLALTSTQTASALQRTYGAQAAVVRLGAGLIAGVYIARKVWRAGHKTWRLLSPLRRILGSAGRLGMLSILGPAASFLLLLLRSLRIGGGKISLFAAELAAGLLRAGAAEGDHVFIPTLHEVELLGLLQILRKDPQARTLIWHLLYRRNIYVGRVADYGRQDEGLRSLRNTFNLVRTMTGGTDLRFYTDTDELTEQYDRLGVFPFVTLPIPVEENYVKPLTPRDPDAPLEIVYMGDARHEKGFHILPQMVDDLCRHGETAPRLHFTFQSNYNIPEGEPDAVVAHRQLALMKEVTLADGPFDAEQYRAMIMAADIILIPYNPLNYFARSSGIFAEAMRAGIPVVIPSSSWMAAQLEPAIHRHVEAVLEQAKPSWKPAARVEANETPLRGGDVGRFRRPQGSTHFCIEIAVAASSVPTGLVFAISEYGRDDVLLDRYARISRPVKGVVRHLLELDRDCVEVGIFVREEESSAVVKFNSITVGGFESATPLPLSAVGAIYAWEIEASTALAEIVRHYDHYRRTAAEFARTWGRFYNPHTLVRMMLTADADCSPSQARGEMA